MHNGSLINFEAKNQAVTPVNFSFNVVNTLIAPRYEERKEHVDEKSIYKLTIPDILANCARKQAALRTNVMDETIHCEIGDIVLCYACRPSQSFLTILCDHASPPERTARISGTLISLVHYQKLVASHIQQVNSSLETK